MIILPDVQEMHCRRPGKLRLIFQLLLLPLPTCGWAADRPVNVLESGTDAVERQLEMGRHERLADRKAQPGSVLAPFTTDGCSGGLSEGWKYLSRKIDAFHTSMGSKPAWESCCVTHDRAYHTGGERFSAAQDSFLARKQADLALKACVLATGKNQAPVLAAEYKLTPQDVDALYSTIAALMYRAVRVGGMPCIGLPWRWGYGWPTCE